MWGLDGQGERHVRERGVPSLVVSPVDPPEPALRPFPGTQDLRPEPVPDRALVVPQGHRMESVLKPSESILGMRTPVHEVADPE